MVYPSRLWILALAVACAGPDDDKDGVSTDDTTPVDDTMPADDTDDTVDTDSMVDTDPVVDTDVDPNSLNLSQMTVSEEIMCSSPSMRLDLGAYHKLTAREDPQGEQWFVGGGVAVGDFDQDGDHDWFLTGETENRIYAWDGSVPRDATSILIGGIDLTDATGAVTVDIEGDGDLDIFVTRYQRENVLLLNDGLERFNAVPGANGLLGHPGDRSLGASFADVDHDGDLDAFVSAYGPIDLTGPSAPQWDRGDPNRVYENVGNGQFEERPGILIGPALTGYTFVGGWFDLDDDGEYEVYVANDFGPSQGENYVNYFDETTWTFTDGDQKGLDVGTHGMGLGVGDINEDGQYDVLVSAWGNVHLLTSQGPLYFDSTLVMGMGDLFDDQTVAWGNQLVDIDNDSYLDAVVNFGYVEVQDRWPNPIQQSDAVFMQDPPGWFTDQAPELGMQDDYSSRGLGFADLNRDGFIDMIKPALDDNDVLYISRCNENRFLRMTFETPDENTFGIGTRVKARVGNRMIMQTLKAGGDTLSSGGPPELVIGLGDHETIDRLEIRWPDNTVETWVDVPTRRHLHVQQVRP